MKPITSFDRSTVRQVNQTSLNILIVELAKLGLKVTPKTAKFSSTQVTLKFEVTTPEMESKSQKLDAELLGLPKNVIGKVFKIPGKRGTFRVTGFSPNRPKFSVNIENVQTGRKLLAPTSLIKAYVK